MPARGGKGERRLEEALSALTRALSRVGAPWMIIGGIAVIARGVRRLTTDIDAVVRGDAADPAAVLDVLAQEQIRPRIADALAFARENLVLLARHAPTGVDLDVSFAWSAFEHAALASRSPAKFGRFEAPMASPEDLVVFKVVACRPKDLEDAEALLVLHPSIDVARARRHVAELAELAESDSIIEAFERAVAAAIAGSVPAKKRSVKPRLP